MEQLVFLDFTVPFICWFKLLYCDTNKLYHQAQRFIVIQQCALVSVHKNHHQASSLQEFKNISTLATIKIFVSVM